jgi:RHS repeat-associated protein
VPVNENLKQKFTGKERDTESGLDYFGARYYASKQGRFTGADEIFKDSFVADPQSWNKYVYVRNNPLKFVDPTGEKATVTIATDEERRTGKITVKATIAIWNSSGLTQEQLQKAAQEYKANIEKAWSGTYEQDGIKFEVSTTVEISVHTGKNAEADATASKSQNVLEVVDNQGHSYIRPASPLGGPDRGQIALDAGTRNSEAAHEFAHILGVNDRGSGAFVSNTKGAGRSMNATPFDYGWAFGGEITRHRNGAQSMYMTGMLLPANPSAIWASRKLPRHETTRELGAPTNTGTGFDAWR